MKKLIDKSYYLNGILFSGFILFMFIQSLPVIYGYFSEEINSIETLLDGEIMRGLEQEYDEKIFLREPSVASWGWVRFHLLSEGQPGVVPGIEGWMFTDEEYFQPRRLMTSFNSSMEKVLEYRQQLSDKGKQLIILPIPMKTDVYSEYTRVSPSLGTDTLYEKFYKTLSKEGIKVVPIRDTFIKHKKQDLLFYKTDTHWTPYGAALAAKAVAEQAPELVGTVFYSTTKDGDIGFKGDLQNFYASAYIDKNPLFRPEVASKYITQRDGEISNAALFGDNKVEVALVGTSYSEIEKWHFSGALKQALQNDLVVVANRRLGPFDSMNEFVKEGYLDDPDINKVIWEFPLRTIFYELPLSETGWQETMESIF